MLTKKQKETIRNLNISQSAERVRNGMMIDGYGREMIFPSSDEIENMAFQKLIHAGFHFTRVAPNKANCIIRISVVRHFSYDSEFTINYYEVNFYTQKKSSWTMTDAFGEEREITYSTHTTRFYLEDDKPPILIEPDSFHDFYVKIFM